MTTHARLLSLLLPSFALVACGTTKPPPPTPNPVTASNQTGAATLPGDPPPQAAVVASVPPPPPIRSVDAILADAVAAIGGEAAWNAHSTMRLKVELTFQGMGISGTAERLSARADKNKPDRMLLTTDVPGTGTLRQGTDGVVFWSEDPINGLRTLTGAEAEQARADAAWVAELRIREIYKSVEVKNEPGPGGARLECLVLTPKEGSAITSCYDAKTHLQVLVKGTHTTPQGESPFLSAIRDWTDVNGLKMPRTVDTQEGPLTFTMRLVDTKLDEPIDDAVFGLPKPPAPAAPEGKGAGKAKAKTKAPAPAKK
jgi:hypothetical protein